MAMEITGNGTHQHGFSLLQSDLSFTCDACGKKGDRAPCVCTRRNLIVHKDCVSLPPAVDIACHNHPLSHVYFLSDDEPTIRNCRFCHGEVDTEYGSYICSESGCDYILHVNCARSPDLQGCLIVPANGEDGRSIDSITRAIEGVRIGGTSEGFQTHFSHPHELVLSTDFKGKGKKCAGCLLPLSGSVYSCPQQQCDLFLHKRCAELPSKEKHWAHHKFMTLFSSGLFRCSACGFSCSGFGYTCDGCGGCLCIRCFPVPDAFRHDGLGNTIIFHHKHEGPCSGCGKKTRFAYRCQDSWFDFSCLTLPSTASPWQHGEHSLTLSYKAVQDCDICQDESDQSPWSYSCQVCNEFNAHPQCVLGKFPFIKRGGRYRTDAHPHLISVDVNNDYRQCDSCSEHIHDDLALECSQSGCIFHWDCLKDVRSRD